jgi:hypothetical protein
MALCDYTKTILYNEARNVCRPANGSDGKKDEMPSGNKSSEQQLQAVGQSGVEDADIAAVQGYDGWA